MRRRACRPPADRHRCDRPLGRSGALPTTAQAAARAAYRARPQRTRAHLRSIVCGPVRSSGQGGKPRQGASPPVGHLLRPRVGCSLDRRFWSRVRRRHRRHFWQVRQHGSWCRRCRQCRPRLKPHAAAAAGAADLHTPTGLFPSIDVECISLRRRRASATAAGLHAHTDGCGIHSPSHWHWARGRDLACERYGFAHCTPRCRP